MKAKNILMTLLLVTGAIAAKASGFPPELALVSQPVMVYNHSSITVYYDVENIGDYTYRGYVSVYLNPDYGYSYDEEYVKVRPGRIKRISMEIPLRRINRSRTFTIMPYYELGDELYSFTTFEHFDPIRFYWDGPRTERWVVVTVPPCIRYYHRPGSYRYYYDGFRPPMPPAGHELRPMDPMHHTYGYHHNNGGYPATHHFNEGTTPPTPANNSSNMAPSASVRPNGSAGSMSSASNSGGNSAPAPNSGSSSGRVNRPTATSSSGTARPSTGSSSSVSRPSSTTSSGTSRPSTGSSSSVSRPSSTSSSGTSRPSSGSSSVSRPSSTSSSSSARPSSSTRSSSSSSSVGRTSTSTSSTRSSATSSSNGSTSRSSSASSGSRSGSSSGRR